MEKETKPVRKDQSNPRSGTFAKSGGLTGRFSSPGFNGNRDASSLSRFGQSQDKNRNPKGKSQRPRQPDPMQTSLGFPTKAPRNPRGTTSTSPHNYQGIPRKRAR